METNLFRVARMSWWPETSESVAGRYFSTLLLESVAVGRREGGRNGGGQERRAHKEHQASDEGLVGGEAARTDHGRLSSASTGRFAALLLPLGPSETETMGGTSMSMSSPESDMAAG